MVVDELLSKIGFETDTKPLEKVEQALEGIKRRLEFQALIEVGRSIFEATHRFAEFAETMGVAATSAGITVEEMQRLEFAAGQSGVGIEEMSGAMARMTRGLYEARNGSAEATKAFEDAGITASQLQGFRTGRDALAALADCFQSIQDPIKKQALAMQLLGRGSYNMVELLSQGSASLDEFGKRADAVGAVASGRDIEGLRAFGDAMSGLFQTIRAFSIHIAAVFAPAIQAVVAQLQTFWMAHRKVISSGLLEWIGKIAFGFGFLIGFMEGVVKDFRSFAANLQEIFGDKAGGGLAAIFGIAGLVALANPMKVVGLAFNTLSGSVRLLGRGLKWVAVGAWSLVEKAFPLLVEWLGSLVVAMAPFAGTIALVVAGLAALILAGEAAYTMLYKGGKFEDTWLGKMYKGVKSGANWMLKKLGIVAEEPEAQISDAAAPKPLAQVAKDSGLQIAPVRSMLGSGVMAGIQNNLRESLTNAVDVFSDMALRKKGIASGGGIEDDDLGFGAEDLAGEGAAPAKPRTNVTNNINVTLQAAPGEPVESQLRRADAALRHKAALATVSTTEKH